MEDTSENDSSCRDAICTSKNVEVSGGSLILTARKESYKWANFTTGAVDSRDKRFFTASEGSPFRLCASVKTPGGTGTGAGLWPAVWMMPNDDSCWPSHGEMDILEEINGDGVAHATYHKNTTSPGCGKDSAGTASMKISTMHTEFHEYSVERSLSSLLFVYDGVVVYNSTVNSLDVLPGIPWYLILNFAIGGPWPKPVNSSTIFPSSVFVDYVRVSKPTAQLF